MGERTVAGYSLNHRWGDSDSADSFSEAQLRDLLSELDADTDDEHTDVTICDSRTGWFLTAYAGDGGLVTWESDDEGPFHMRGLGRDRVLELFRRVASGEGAGLADEPWQAGYG